ncbi:uncharacterized protein LOC116841793 [Odontomachus brunneus]|uniref:uncharacterized protein LOC116841793 n=1 Tax=Odontomachus brunneus TaxID=486640 RepID=UPI0013F27E4B|nr:uncharacterized protein LOC116841793 [Odontomachus brunneus]
MQSYNSLDGESTSNKAANKRIPSTTGKKNTEKKRLRENIQKLRCIIEKAEWALEMLRFKDVERKIEPRNPKTSHFSKFTNVEVQLQNDLYKFAGFRCVKFKRTEAIFNFTSANEQQNDNTYAVQTLIKDGKASLGRWVMPMSVDMNEILTKTPIDKLKNLTAFMKNCKHNINCYTVRQEQFLSLKKYILHMKHYALHSNIGYMQINLELYGVHDREDDKYIDLILYLLYHSDEARPYTVKIDTTTKNKLSDETNKRLKVYLKEFKISDLQSAFDKVFMKTNSAFRWIQADDNESPLEINDTSISDEGDFLEQLQSERKKSLTRIKRKRELQNKWNKRKKQEGITKNITSSGNNSNDDAHSEAEISHTKSPHQTLINEKETEEIVSSLKQQKQNDKNLLETTPINKSKLKQTKLNFKATQSKNSSNVNESSSFQSKPRTKLGNKNRKVAQLITSTPLNSRVSGKLISTLELDNITEIGSPLKEATDNINDLKKNSRLKNKTLTKKKKGSKVIKKS